MITTTLRSMLANDTERFIVAKEGYESTPYRCMSGKLTIGIGWNLDAGITERAALLVFRDQIKTITDALTVKFSWFGDLNEARRAALISMAFQMGLAGLYGFRQTLAYVEAGQYEAAAAGMLASKWARQTPKRARETAYMMRYGKFPE